MKLEPLDVQPLTAESRNINRIGGSEGGAFMESDSPYNGGVSAPPNFAFAFNDSNFSDRILRIEIMSGPTESKSDGEGCSSIADWARNRKRRREDIKKEAGFLDGCEEHIMISNHPDVDDAAAYENPDEEAEAMMEESPNTVAMLSSPAADDCGHGPSWGMDCSTLVNVRTIHISSAILAAKSPFFLQTFFKWHAGVRTTRCHSTYKCLRRSGSNGATKLHVQWNNSNKHCFCIARCINGCR